MRHVVGIGDMAFSNVANDTIVTHSLGSCIAVTMYCKRLRKGGMIHIALPSGQIHSNIRKKAYFADLGLPCFLDAMISGAETCKSEWDIQLFGGANTYKKDDVFQIGLKNLNEVSRILRKYAFDYKKVAVGGSKSRTVELNIGTGYIKLYEYHLKL